ncbi:peptidyl-tRNA hydrolase [Achaetomium macrosporum]|uniref:peptidyl-tRNA hydrolase n=1 Tax=Achaetomium macrosporum TaxID=79813 RepID=A0AAN7HAB7_9PEZI|nr:peptidyl-tRNA hydrolase [Achaetomium macrosporum]
MPDLKRIIIVSLGNPGRALDTYHSAGHQVVELLPLHLGRHQPNFEYLRIAKKSTRCSIGPRYSIFQSPTLMNLSGPWVSKAYHEHLAEQNLKPGEVGFVLVHDDMEVELGELKIRDWNRSHRGHNGVRSVKESLKAYPDGSWARVSVGIGRPREDPKARDRNTVSNFVLAMIPQREREILTTGGPPRLYDCLYELGEKWGGESWYDRTHSD